MVARVLVSYVSCGLGVRLWYPCDRDHVMEAKNFLFRSFFLTSVISLSYRSFVIYISLLHFLST